MSKIKIPKSAQKFNIVHTLHYLHGGISCDWFSIINSNGNMPATFFKERLYSYIKEKFGDEILNRYGVDFKKKFKIPNVSYDELEIFKRQYPNEYITPVSEVNYISKVLITPKFCTHLSKLYSSQKHIKVSKITNGSVQMVDKKPPRKSNLIWNTSKNQQFRMIVQCETFVVKNVRTVVVAGFALLDINHKIIYSYNMQIINKDILDEEKQKLRDAIKQGKQMIQNDEQPWWKKVEDQINKTETPIPKIQIQQAPTIVVPNREVIVGLSNTVNKPVTVSEPIKADEVVPVILSVGALQFQKICSGIKAGTLYYINERVIDAAYSKSMLGEDVLAIRTENTVGNPSNQILMPKADCFYNKTPL